MQTKTGIATRGYAAATAGAPLAPFEFTRREVGPHDILYKIEYCGICHSDIHQARAEWDPNSIFPMVPGHELAGRVTQVGNQVTRFKVGDAVGVGCMVDSCRTCDFCKQGLEQFCEKIAAFTYNGTEMDRKTPTYGGYSDLMVVDETFALKMPENLDLARSAPLLCAGITTYSPLRHWKVGKGQRVGIIGLGGLGHMAVQFAAAFGAEVTVFSTTRAKEADARRLGAHHFVATNEEGALEKMARSHDFLLSTVSSQYVLAQYLNVLKVGGTLTIVGVPASDKAPQFDVMPLLLGRLQIAGSLIGGIPETQEMLDFCGEHNIMSDIELVPMSQVNEAFDRVVKSDVRYRFVLDLATL